MPAESAAVAGLEWLEFAKSFGVPVAANLVVAAIAVITMRTQSRDLRFQISETARQERELLREERRISAAQTIALSFAWYQVEIEQMWRAWEFDRGIEHLRAVNTANQVAYRWLPSVHGHARELWGLVLEGSVNLKKTKENAVAGTMEASIDRLLPGVREVVQRIDSDCQAVMDGPDELD